MKFLPQKTNSILKILFFVAILFFNLNANAQCTPAGDQAAYGQGQWTGYVYSDNASFATPPTSVSALTYRGYMAQTEAFDFNPEYAAISGANICGTYADYYTIRFKMNKTYTAGYYSITVGADDGYRLSLDGGATWNTSLSDWDLHGYTTKTDGVLLDGSTNLILEYFENTGGSRVSFSITSLDCASTAPTAISGTNMLDCTTQSATLTATGGTGGYGATYQWGTGTVAGQNIIAGQTTGAITVAPDFTTTYWVRRTNAAPCTGYTDAAYQAVTVTARPGNPAAFGNGTWNVYGYNGGNIDLTGINYEGFYTQSGLNFDSTTVWDSNGSPSSAATWQGCALPNDVFTFVYKRQGFPCGRYAVTMTRWDDEAVLYINGVQAWYKPAWSGGLVNDVAGFYDLDENSTIELRVRESYGGANAALMLIPAAGPTSISGVTALGCGVTTTTLTAQGGTVNGAGNYQWGTGTIPGENILNGQTAASIIVSPSENTTYWVRLIDFNNCVAYSSAVITTVTVASPGNPDAYGNYTWNAYAYSGTSLTLADAVYLGHYTQNTLGFDTTTGTNSWSNALSPSSSVGYSGCIVPNDNFVLVYKRRGFECGSYKISFTRWDDDAELYIDGVIVWSRNGWSGPNPVDDVVGTYNLTDTSVIEFRVHEGTGESDATMVITPLSVASVAPASIAGPSDTQCGASATLTAVGGTLGTNAAYTWGTGTIGSNIITGATTATITVAPQVATTYWVAIKNNLCNAYTSGVTFTVNSATTVPGTLSAVTTTVCKNSVPSAITLNGYSGNIIKWQSADDAAFTQGVVDIASTNAVLTPAQIGILTATKYYRAVVQNSTCIQLTTPVLQLTVPAPVVWNGTWSSTPTAATAIEVQADLTLDANLTVCSCQVKNTAVFTVNSDVNLTVKGKVTVDATAKMVLQNKASLLQTDDVDNQGNIEAHRNSSKIKRLDYTIWSSPVDNQQLKAFSPATSTNRFYEYSTSIDGYMPIVNTNNFELAKGYLIRAPNNYPTTPTVYDGVFTGTPHNGTVTKALSYEGNGYNAIGNPYPSPISVNEFIDANINNIEGTLWFWRKSNDMTQSSYTVVTKFAYVANSAPGGENDFAVNPGGYLNTGQGFFVKAKNSNNVVFTNSMRHGGSSNQFFKSAQTVTSSKYYLNVTDTNGLFTQAVIGYTAEATLDYDNGLDGRAFVDNSINIYSLQADNKLAIQVRPEFDVMDIVPLGIKANSAGTFSISLTNTDGVFTDAQLPVYVWDTVEGIVFNLKNAPYSFTADAGVDETRFKMIYSAQALGTDAPELTNSSVMIYVADGQLKVTSDEPIKSVTAYDMLGRQLLNQTNVSNTTFSGTVLASQQVLVVKVLLENGKSAERKVIIK